MSFNPTKTFLDPRGKWYFIARPRETAEQPLNRKIEQVLVPDGTTLLKLEDIVQNIKGK